MRRRREQVFTVSVLALIGASMTLTKNAGGQYPPFTVMTIPTIITLPSIAPAPTVVMPMTPIPIRTVDTGARPARTTRAAGVTGVWESDDGKKFRIERGTASTMGQRYSVVRLDGSGADEFPGQSWRVVPDSGALVGTWSNGSNTWDLRVTLSADQQTVFIAYSKKSASDGGLVDESVSFHRGPE